MNDQKNSIEACGSTTPEVDLKTKNNKILSKFLASFNKLTRKASNLLENKNTITLENIVLNIYYKILLHI